MATGLEIARFYAAKPKVQRPRTMVFLVIPDHHHGENGRALVIKTYDFSKTAVILNLEHTSQTLLYMVNQDLMNVPDTAGNDWPLRTPGNTRPESFFFQ